MNSTELKLLMKKCFHLGESYSYYGESESFYDHRRSEKAWKEFQELLEEPRKEIDNEI